MEVVIQLDFGIKRSNTAEDQEGPAGPMTLQVKQLIPWAEYLQLIRCSTNNTFHISEVMVLSLNGSVKLGCLAHQGGFSFPEYSSTAHTPPKQRDINTQTGNNL